VESIGDAGRAALASPVGKKVLAWVANVRLHGDIALDLVVQSEPEYVVQSEPELSVSGFFQKQSVSG